MLCMNIKIDKFYRNPDSDLSCNNHHSIETNYNIRLSEYLACRLRTAYKTTKYSIKHLVSQVTGLVVS